jgi:spore coat protein U-like protein
MRHAYRLALALAALASSPIADAATATGTFQVSATVVSACTVSGALLNFGNSLDPLSAATPVDSTSALTVQCTNSTPYAVSLSAGANAGGATNFASRAIKHGSSTLGYQLYLDASRSTVWGDGTSSSSTQSGTGSGSNQSLTIYGRLPSLSGAVPGTYTDTVTVTITY